MEPQRCSERKIENVAFGSGSTKLKKSTAARFRVHGDLNGHGRLVIRPSGTEPVIRVMGEGDDKTLVEAVVDDIVGALTDVAA